MFLPIVTLTIEYANTSPSIGATWACYGGCMQRLKLGEVCISRVSSKSSHSFHPSCASPPVRKAIIANDFVDGGVEPGDIARVMRVAKEEQEKAERLEQEKAERLEQEKAERLELEKEERKKAESAKKAHASANPAIKAAPAKKTVPAKKAAPAKKVSPKKATPAKRTAPAKKIAPLKKKTAPAKKTSKVTEIDGSEEHDDGAFSPGRASAETIGAIATIAASHEALAKGGGLNVADRRDLIAIQKAVEGLK